jgi:hypothetical protein
MKRSNVKAEERQQEICLRSCHEFIRSDPAFCESQRRLLPVAMVVHARQWVDVLLEACPEAADFRCPLSHVVMFDPVTATDGITYEWNAIEIWLEAHDTSPMVRDGAVFRVMTKELTPNRERKAAVDRVVREYHDDQPFPVDPEVVEWDSEALQVFLPDRRSLTLSSVESVVPPPRGVGARAVADMTSD